MPKKILLDITTKQSSIKNKSGLTWAQVLALGIAKVSDMIKKVGGK